MASAPIIALKAWGLGDGISVLLFIENLANLEFWLFGLGLNNHILLEVDDLLKIGGLDVQNHPIRLGFTL